MVESPVGVPLYYTMPCVRGQVRIVTSHPRQGITDMSPIVAAALQTRLERKRAYRKDV